MIDKLEVFNRSDGSRTALPRYPSANASWIPIARRITELEEPVKNEEPLQSAGVRGPSRSNNVILANYML